MKPVIFLELNEINFDFVQTYARQGRLPALARLLDDHRLSRTTSEAVYAHLEPWIQWVTAHTGLSYQEHGVFRLGDITGTRIPQIWEQLESAGLRVGAVSPMNARNDMRAPCFFLPDPWTPTDVTAPPLLRRLFTAICQVVGDNASGRLTAKSAAWLMLGAARYARPRNYGRYLRLALGSVRHHWQRAIFLDLLLADVFVALTRKTRPDFATLFLNAGAHIQHHYMFCSAAYDGVRRNPDWYIDAGADPVLAVYQLYDDIVGQLVEAFPGHRLMLATGLHQEPHPELTYYWRLRDHAGFLTLAGVPFASVEPRMSRDFVIRCDSPAMAKTAETRLNAMAGSDGVPLFAVDNRGNDLFVELTYPNDVSDSFGFAVEAQPLGALRPHIAFVAVKNGKHDGVGYFLDTGASHAEEFRLSELPKLISTALGVRIPANDATGAPGRVSRA